MNLNLEIESIPARPRIKKYSNVVTFIRDTFNYRKSVDPSFTLDLWSYELGFKSRSFLFMICSGQRKLTPKFVETFAASENFSECEENHMHLLAYYHKAKTVNHKSIYLDKILESLELGEKAIDLKNHSKFLSNVSMPLIKLVLAFDDVKITATELSVLLNIEIKKLRKDLSELETMGLVQSAYVETSSEKIWKSKTKAFVVPDDRKNDALDLYHQSTMEEAISVLQGETLQRRFRTIFFAIKDEDQTDLLSEIEFFLSKMKNKYGCDDLNNKKVMKLNLQTYPVTELFNSQG